MAIEIIRSGIERALRDNPSGIPADGGVEAFFRRQICLEANKRLRIWSGSPPKKPEKPWHKSFVLTKTYDLCWSRPNIEIPEVVMQMKVGGFHSQSQEVQELLSDVLFAGYDQLLLNAPSCFYTCAILFDNRTSANECWAKLKSLRSQFFIVLNPSSSTNERASLSECIDLRNMVIYPRMRSHLNNIFGGTQATKYIGLYRKPGQIEIQVRPMVFQINNSVENFTVLLWQVMNTCLTGSDHTIDRWMP